MHVEMKFATNITPAEDDEAYLDGQADELERSPSPTRSVCDGLQDYEIASKELSHENLTVNDKRLLTKCLVKPNLQYREKLMEIVKDFPTARNEVPMCDNNTGKSLGENLYDTV